MSGRCLLLHVIYDEMAITLIEIVLEFMMLDDLLVKYSHNQGKVE